MLKVFIFSVVRSGASAGQLASVHLHLHLHRLHRLLHRHCLALQWAALASAAQALVAPAVGRLAPPRVAQLVAGPERLLGAGAA